MIRTDKVYLTKEGLEASKKELDELVNVKRPQIAERIKSARDLGDISENSEYVASREEQSFIEGRIQELEDILKRVSVIENNNRKDIVSLGSTVMVHVDGSDDEFSIVGAPEANPMQKKISHASPLGEALLGKKIGDKVSVEAPMGVLVYTILKIK